MKFLSLLATFLSITACSAQTRRPEPMAPDQYVLPVKPGDVITIHSLAGPSVGATGADVSRAGSGSTRGNADAIRVRSAAPAALGYDAILSGFTYPFEVHYFDLRSQDEPLRMAYMDEAPASPTGTVVLLHDLSFPSFYWDRTIRSLVAAGYRVIAPDQIGFGKSTKPVRYQFSFAVLCDNTRRLLASLGVRRASFVGHGMGGMLAVRCAIGNPALVDRLVLVNPLGLEDWSLKVPYAPIDDSYHRELTRTAADVRADMRQNYFDGNWSPAYDGLAGPLLGLMDGPDRARIAWDRALEEDMIFNQPVVQDFPRITQPTTLIIGQHDRTAFGRDRVSDVEAARLGDYPSLGRRAARAIPGARLVELPLAGHVPMIDSFGEFERALGTALKPTP